MARGLLEGGGMRIALLWILGACTTAEILPDAAELPDCEPAGRLTIYALPPPLPLDWSSPNNLLRSVQASRERGNQLVAAGEVAMGHSIGHVNFELDCGADSIALTGQTGGGAEWQAVTDGAGLLLRDTPGAMDDMELIGDREETIADVGLRQASGNLTRISFVVNQRMCRRIKEFVDAYVQAGAYRHYSGVMRARRMEGAGCAIFGAGLVDVGGLLRRSLFTPVWARSKLIGSARIADFLGDGSYRYGGNLVARDDAGTHWLWPKNQDVPTSASTPVWIFSPVLDAWSGPEDLPFDVPGLTGELRTKLPFTIYDPQMMAEWGEAVWREASAHGEATSFGVTWMAGTVERAHEVTFDARCVQPQAIAFGADHDDLFEDSDAR